MSQHRYFIHLAYKGTNYFGWQVQPNHKSVQETIEKALTQMNSNQKVEITGCGRTDTGVHASNYYAHFDSAIIIDCDLTRFKLNLMLPSDIAIKSIFPVKETAHSRHDAISRTYQYQIHSLKDPFLSEFSWQLGQKLNLLKINEACEIIKKHENFESFSKVKTAVNHFNCTIQSISWEETETGYLFTISANRFLRSMVRSIVGTLVEVGLEKITPNDVDLIIRSKNRGSAGKSAPAEGLVLTKIVYPFLP